MRAIQRMQLLCLLKENILFYRISVDKLVHIQQLIVFYFYLHLSVDLIVCRLIYHVDINTKAILSYIVAVSSYLPFEPPRI